MIPNTADTVEVVSNITGETGQFTVDENSLGKIMSVLTNLYSDPEMAVVREYLTNALDSQIEAQEKDPNYVWRPIEVTTPSHFNKSYIVRDYGIGMSVDDLKEIYSKYGKSTKETSNAVTGMLGLGSKCALTYTGQFTITGYKNGVRTKALVSKDENDIPVFMIVDTRASSEPNGVEVSVPVRDRNTFAEKTKNFLRWWKDGQVLVDGREPAKHDYTEVKPGVFMIDRGHSYDPPQSYIIMGNVPYSVDFEYVDESLREAGMGFAAYVDMGSVDFPPSREKLFYNARTKAVVKTISDGLFEHVLAAKLKEVTDAADFREAFVKYSELPRHFANHPKAKTLSYKGVPFPLKSHAHDNKLLTWDWQGHGQISERGYISLLDAARGAIIVTGVPYASKPTSYFKKKVRQYAMDNGISAPIAYLVEKDVDTPWLDYLPRVDADTIKAIKLSTTNTPSGPRTVAEYDTYALQADGTVKYLSEAKVTCPKGKTVAYISPSDMRETYRRSGTTADILAKNLGEKFILVVLATNRFDKFLRSHQNAVHARTAMQARINELVNSATAAEFMVGNLEYSEKEFLKRVDESLLDDPELAQVARLVKSPASQTQHYNSARDLVVYARRAGMIMQIAEPKHLMKTTNVVKRYPLINSAGGVRQTNHLVIYINAVYQQEYAPKAATPVV